MNDRHGNLLAVAPIYYRSFITHEPLTTQDSLRTAGAAPVAACAGAI
ncbi:hypothetical protein [Nocardia pseudovaccinii]|nr:hypothetical protein [Nocardia pseudovaccinii]